MKKLIAGIMSLLLVGVMALPAAAQGRNGNRDNQRRSQMAKDRRDNNRLRGHENQGNSRFNGTRGQLDDFDQYGWKSNWQQRGRNHFRFNDRRFNNHGNQH